MKCNETEMSSLIELIKIKLEAANENGTLDINLKKMGLSSVEENRSTVYMPDPSGRIVVLGSSMVKPQKLIGIGKQMGISARRFDFHLDYDTNILGRFQYDRHYAAIFVGPMPHSMRGMGYYSSGIRKMEIEEGYPPVIRLEANAQGLKITHTSFRKGLQFALDHNHIVADLMQLSA